MSKSRRSQRNQKSFLNEVSEKESRGLQQQAILNHNKYQKYDLDWFKPRGRQVEIMDAVDTHDWVAVVSKNKGKPKHLGLFKTEIEAFNSYKTAKETFIKEQANNWKSQIDIRAYNALMNYKVEITD